MQFSFSIAISWVLEYLSELGMIIIMSVVFSDANVSSCNLGLTIEGGKQFAE